MMKGPLLVFTLILLLPTTLAVGQERGAGDMDALLGPATVVNQGTGMTDEIRRALSPGPEHAVLARLVGTWRVEGTAGRNNDPVHQTAEVTEILGGAWFELRLLEDGELVRLAHLGFDGYRRSYAIWEVGRGFTSPQVRAGESRSDGQELHYWRTYTIRRRDVPTRVDERLVLTFLPTGAIRWQSFETIEGQDERTQKDVIYTRVR